MTAAADFPAAAAAVDADELAEVDRFAERVAELVAARMTGNLPAWAAELLAEWGSLYQRTPVLYPPGGGYAELESRLAGGRLELVLWINGARTWSTMLGADNGTRGDGRLAAVARAHGCDHA